jgi:DNA polymerase III epsilon subunit-like protein
MLTDETGKELRNQSFIVRPDGFEIPASATRVHGITTQTARRLGIELEKVLTAFANDLSAANILVGAINIAVYNLPVTNCSEMQRNASVYI